MEKSKFIIGIDPDIDRSGVAVWDKKSKRFFKLETMRFWDLADFLHPVQWNGIVDVMVLISAGWLIDKSNWHGKNQSSEAKQKIAMNVGINHASGKLIEQFCIKHKIPYRLVKPTGKVDAAYFKRLTGWKGRTNQDVRDAGMLCYGL